MLPWQFLHGRDVTSLPFRFDMAPKKDAGKFNSQIFLTFWSFAYKFEATDCSRMERFQSWQPTGLSFDATVRVIDFKDQLEFEHVLSIYLLTLNLKGQSDNLKIPLQSVCLWGKMFTSMMTNLGSNSWIAVLIQRKAVHTLTRNSTN